MPEIQKKKTSPATVAGIIILIAALAAMAVYFIFIFSPKKAEEEVSADPASAPVFSAPESSEPEEISAELKTTLAEAEAGDLVRYGNYIQIPGANADGDVSPIEWIVLDKQEDRLLLLSYRVLEIWSYDDSRESGITGFSQSGLCKNLDRYFYGSAFSESEREYILGEEGQKVFILTAAEAEKYLTPDSHRIARATHTAADHHGRDDSKPIEWWLADITSPGFAAYVYTDGSIRLKGLAFDYDKVGVRPAIWVSAEAEAE
ncbi:MAG: hypothetical protein IJQ53_05515 [Clostridia bacterium]|nr:hypothetical protein [Clostridia bacterium]